MSRALGHKFLSKYGVVPDPAVNCIPVKDLHRFLVLTSDGVSDVLECQELFDFIHEKRKQPDFHLETLANDLVTESAAAWKRKYPVPKKAAEITDNITVIVVDLLALCK